VVSQYSAPPVPSQYSAYAPPAYATTAAPSIYSQYAPPASAAQAQAAAVAAAQAAAALQAAMMPQQPGGQLATANWRLDDDTGSGGVTMNSGSRAALMAKLAQGAGLSAPSPSQPPAVASDAAAAAAQALALAQQQQAAHQAALAAASAAAAAAAAAVPAIPPVGGSLRSVVQCTVVHYTIALSLLCCVALYYSTAQYDAVVLYTRRAGSSVYCAKH
jgi:linker between RRM2 and RRM3 domains in RBM39 protein